ncbi:MAG: T9SS type A sorting domain-containing protein [Bacteroidetes bacterium]|nr:T9SS type A sorting domain-containing protein [Bacteroidota bacterium]
MKPFKVIPTIILVCSVFLFLNTETKAQTYPSPYNLSLGSYHFTSWDSLSAAGTYPSNMIFQFVPSNHIAPFYDDSATDFSCPYNMSKRPRVNGYMYKGIGFVTTSNSQYNDCSSGTASKRFMGAALLSLNTSARSSISVQWKSETMVPGDGNGSPSTPRIWNLRLQYRVGSSGNFTDVPGPVEFVAGTTTGDSLTLGPTVLPSECNNKSVVQVRWIYFESSAGSGGTRPRLRLDDIEVQSASFLGLEPFTAQGCELFPNPARSEFFIHNSQVKNGSVDIMNELGKIIRTESLDNENNRYSCSDLSSGIYLVRVTDNMTRSTKVMKLIIK